MLAFVCPIICCTDLTSAPLLKSKLAHDLRISCVEYDGKLYYATDGWIVFQDIEVYAPDAYLSGSFEFNASTEDTSDTIHISNGTFERVPSNYIYHKEGDKPWYKKYL